LKFVANTIGAAGAGDVALDNINVYIPTEYATQLSAGAIAGIVIGVSLFVILVAGAIILCIFFQRKRKQDALLLSSDNNEMQTQTY